MAIFSVTIERLNLLLLLCLVYHSESKGNLTDTHKDKTDSGRHTKGDWVPAVVLTVTVILTAVGLYEYIRRAHVRDVRNSAPPQHHQ